MACAEFRLCLVTMFLFINNLIIRLTKYSYFSYTGLIDSWYTSIAASGTPGITTIAEYHNDSHAAYYIVQVEDTTNKRYEMAEVLVADDDTTPVITEWGHIQSGTSGLGTIGVSTTSSARTALTFIPNHNIKVPRAAKGRLLPLNF